MVAKDVLMGAGIGAALAFIADPRGGRRRGAMTGDGLLEHVRSTLGRASSHPDAIDVGVVHGNVTLRGPILAREADDVLAAAGSVRGVVSVTNALTSYESSDGVPGLQGEGSATRLRFDILKRNWAPARQVFVTAAGLAATAVCVAAYMRR